MRRDATGRDQVNASESVRADIVAEQQITAGDDAFQWRTVASHDEWCILALSIGLAIKPE